MIRFGLSKVINTLSKVIRLPSTIVSDTFTRADSATTLGNAETGQAWEVLAGTWGITSNQAYLVSGLGNNGAVVETEVSDCTISLKYVAGTIVRIWYRVTDASNYLIFQANSGSAYKVYRVAAGVVTELAVYSQVPIANDVLKVIINGSSLSFYVNDILLGTLTDAYNQTATKHGISSYDDTGRMDDFKVEVA